VTTIVLASSNPGKLRELQQLLADTNLTVVPQAEFNVSDADETGLTFVENAIIKARHACEQTKLPAIADDSGLSVDALGGAPGIYSSRYSGNGNEANIVKLLEALKDVPEEKRTARYHCVLAFMQHEKDPCPVICHGTWEGIIVFDKKGTQGFGYDPIFYLPERKCTVAELSSEVKQTISHRAKAFEELKMKMNK